MSHGKRAGARPRRTLRPALLGLALGITAAVVAWGYLVKAAIDFGAQGRDGDSRAWWLLALASVGAIACLFIGLILLSRITRALGITAAPPPRQQHPPRNAHQPGRRVAR